MGVDVFLVVDGGVVCHALAEIFIGSLIGVAVSVHRCVSQFLVGRDGVVLCDLVGCLEIVGTGSSARATIISKSVLARKYLFCTCLIYNISSQEPLSV